MYKLEDIRRQGVDGMPPLGGVFTPKDPTLLDYNLMGKGVTIIVLI